MTKEWDNIQKKIEQSTIYRVPWKRILGETLTSRIHKLKNKGNSWQETYDIISLDKNLILFLAQHGKLQRKVLQNLYISVCARYGESKTAERIRWE